MPSTRTLLVLLLLLVGLSPWLPGAGNEGEAPTMQVLRTPEGSRFALYGKKGAAPAPTLFIFANSLEDTDKQPIYTEVGRRLGRHGFLYVVVEPPCHGEDTKPKEPKQLAGWRYRLENNEPLIAPFTTRASAVLNHLVKEGYTDDKKVAACGTSRGGFLALHWAAVERRIKAVAAISPLTDLLAITEFKGLEKHEATRALSAENLAPKLAGRPIWVSIGNDDQRVSTDAAIALTRKLTAAGAAARKDPKQVIPVELIVAPTVGHTAIDHVNELAAAWFLRYFPEPVAPK
jgi:dienelactone hydrolase